MEGVELHPAVDDRGIHWFDIREVEAVRTALRPDCEHRLGMDFSGHCTRATRVNDDEPTAAPEEIDEGASRNEHPSVVEARAWAEQARADAQAIREERRRLESMRRQARSARVKAAREIAQARRELIDELASCDASVLRRLTDYDRAEILALLEEE